MARINFDISNDFVTKVKKMKSSGIYSSPLPDRTIAKLNEMPSLEQRINAILGISANNANHRGKMIFFVMYDIESNKVRNLVVKYLQRQGCSRVQKSIFLANITVEKYNKIKEDLAAVQAAYENNDSILIVPVSTDILQSMKVIGQNIDFDVITNSKNVLFF